MKNVITCITFILFSVNLFSQDTTTITKSTRESSQAVEFGQIKKDTVVAKKNFHKNRLNLAVNIFPILINEVSLYIDYGLSERQSIGVCGGYIYANKNFQVNKLSFDQGKNPGTVWNGIVIRFNYKYYFSVSRKRYIGIEYLYKSLHYSNVKFVNSEGRGDETYSTFVRSEKANLSGINLLYGFHILPIEKRVSVEWFFGLSCRYRIRNYTTLSSINGLHYSKPEPIGTFVLKQTYPFAFVGFKIGINTFLKRSKS